jgi:hypothetical protein
MITDINILLKEILDSKIFDTNIISFFARLSNANNADCVVEIKIPSFSFFTFSLVAIILLKTGLVFKNYLQTSCGNY